MKRISILLGLIAIISVVLLVKHAHATDSAPPTKIDTVVAVRLDRDLAHIREAEAAIARIQEAAKPYSEDALTILSTARIDPQQFNKGEVRVDFATGEITRPPAPKVANK